MDRYFKADFPPESASVPRSALRQTPDKGFHGSAMSPAIVLVDQRNSDSTSVRRPRQVIDLANRPAI
jgi:hypothetical protein